MQFGLIFNYFSFSFFSDNTNVCRFKQFKPNNHFKPLDVKVTFEDAGLRWLYVSSACVRTDNPVPDMIVGGFQSRI